MTSPYVDSRLAPRSFHEPNVATQDANEVGQVGTDANANAWTQASHGGQSLHSSTPESLNRTLSTPPFPPHASLQHYDHRIAASRSLQATSSSLSEHLDWLLIPTKPWKTGRQDVLDTQSQQQQINSISTQYFPQSHVSQCFNDGSIDTKALVANPDGFPIWNGWTGHSQTETHFMNLDPPSKDNLTLMNDTNWDVYRYYKASRMTPLLSTDAYVLGALSHKRPHSSSPNDMLASVTASPKQAYQPIHGTYLSEQPTDAATCTLPSADPHATDMHPFDPDLVPRKQDPKDPPNSYLPRWIRGQGKEREAWCECGRWLSLKKSTYWYHKNFAHGITVTGQWFPRPTRLRPRKHTATTEGLCSTCDTWIPLGGGGGKGSDTSWFRHVYKCHSMSTLTSSSSSAQKIAHSTASKKCESLSNSI